MYGENYILIYSRFVLMHLPGKITYKERGSAKTVFNRTEPEFANV